MREGGDSIEKEDPNEDEGESIEEEDLKEDASEDEEGPWRRRNLLKKRWSL